MKTPSAREVAHVVLPCGIDHHSVACDRLTDAIEERDRTSRHGEGGPCEARCAAHPERPCVLSHAVHQCGEHAFAMSAEVERLRGELEEARRQREEAIVSAEHCNKLVDHYQRENRKHDDLVARLRTLLEEGAERVERSPYNVTSLDEWARKVRAVLNG